MAQLVKNLPARQETWFQSLGLENPLEKGMATYSSITTWRISWTAWTEEPGRPYSPWGCKELDMTEQLTQDVQYLCFLLQALNTHNIVRWAVTLIPHLKKPEL